MEFLDQLIQKLKQQPETYDKKKLFKFGSILGSGAYGEVKEGTIIATGQSVAIKVIRKEVIRGREDLVDTELRTVGKLNHPNIIRLLDWFESRDKYYLVFELATGGELFERICDQGRFTEKDAAELVKVILGAIQHMHQQHIVHRDLKPENLLYKDKSENAPLLIADFGIAKMIDDDDQVMSTVCGSYGYTDSITKGYGKEVDIWSLGVITYALLCGYTPFPMDDSEQFLRMARSGNVDFHPAYWGNISDDAKNFVRALLSADPSARPTCEEALAHKWIVRWTEPSAEEPIDLLTNVRANFNARSQLRKGINAVRLVNRMKRMSQSQMDPATVAAQLNASNHESSSN
ncbi:CAMK/CAMK1 protein kinase [Syncephalis plumigaleata]|nr:CAMK/CAMK1 protein kinase [Syncephalis plumigaleata]